MRPAFFAPLLALSLTLIACSSGPQAAAPATADFPAPMREPARHSHARSSSSSFDYYLLNLSWSPEYCFHHPDAHQCAVHSTFVLHGLWPENNDGSYPEHCSDAPGPANPAQYTDVYPDPGLVQHEWTAHGTCSGLSPDAYFSAARTAFHSIAIPPTLQHLSAQISLTPTEVLGLFTQANPTLSAPGLALSCGNNYLTAVEVCLDINLHPTACQAIRSCRANTVRIPAP